MELRRRLLILLRMVFEMATYLLTVLGFNISNEIDYLPSLF